MKLVKITTLTLAVLILSLIGTELRAEKYKPTEWNIAHRHNGERLLLKWSDFLLARNEFYEFNE